MAATQAVPQDDVRQLERLVEAVTRSFPAATGWELVPTEWTTADERRIGEIAAEKYGRREWNEKR